MNGVFLDILIVLVAAKLAAELAERLKFPPVVGEIIAGIVIGPSALGFISGRGDVLRTLGEIGVILLLLEVGMQMDLRELRAVGRASLSVATLGMILPFGLGYIVAGWVGLHGDAALFTSVALTATSVGITARVFGDLRALATVEARTVLGAAVADDVIGLVILAVVVRLVTRSGGFSVGNVLATIGLALGFLIITTAVGAVLTPPLFALIDRFARSSGTLFALGLAFTLAIAELASLAKLAPIVGAFVAGLSLGRSSSAPRIQRELTPVGHLFIPVFFLQIGIDTDVAQFAKGKVLILAAALIGVAIVSKLAAGLGAIGSPGNKLLIGLGMIPRGEVGLIVAGIGLREGILEGNAYAAVLLMVLVTTLVTPPFLVWQTGRLTRRRASLLPAPDERPATGWLSVEPKRVELAANPPTEATLEVALDAAAVIERAEPGPTLIGYLTATSGPLLWNRAATQAITDLLQHGGVRAWRFLETTGVLERSLPELADTLRRRRNDPALLDPIGLLRWPLLERVRRSEETRIAKELATLDHPDRVAFAALLIDATADDLQPLRTASALLQRLDLDATEASAIAGLVDDRNLLRAAAMRPDGLEEESVVRIATHFETRERARANAVLAFAQNGFEPWAVSRLEELHSLVLACLDRPDLRGSQSMVGQRKLDAIALLPRDLPMRSHVAERISTAPRGYVLAEEPADIARQAALINPVPQKGRFRVLVNADRSGLWRVEIAGRDQIGLLALTTGVLERARLDVLDASLATWGDGAALQAFRVGTEAVGLAPDADAISGLLTSVLHDALIAAPVPDAVVSFDDGASPWHTLTEVRATDRRGLLHALAVSFAAAGADVHAARITTADEMALDRFDLTDRDGRKLDDATKAAIREALAHGVTARGRRPWRTNRVGTIRNLRENPAK